MDFDSLSAEQREEWRRNEVTAMAMAMLREAEALAHAGVDTEVETGGDVLQMKFCAGYRRGLFKAIDMLTRER